MTQQTHSGEPSPQRIQKYLAGVDYPASREDLVRRARELKAPDDVLKLLEQLPDRDFGGPSGVMKAYGQIVH